RLWRQGRGCSCLNRLHALKQSALPYGCPGLSGHARTIPDVAVAQSCAITQATSGSPPDTVTVPKSRHICVRVRTSAVEYRAVALGAGGRRRAPRACRGDIRQRTMRTDGVFDWGIGGMWVRCTAAALVTLVV